MPKAVREKHVDYDVEKLDNAIREIDGDRYMKSRISTFIIGKGSGYYGQCMDRRSISENSLKKICAFYRLKTKDYIINKPKVKPVKEVEPEQLVLEEIPTSDVSTPEETVPVPVVAPTLDITKLVEAFTPVIEKISTSSETTDLTPVLSQIAEITTQLQLMNKTITEILAETKSNTFMVSQLTDRMAQHCKTEKDLLDRLSQNRKHYGNNNFRDNKDKISIIN